MSSLDLTAWVAEDAGKLAESRIEAVYQAHEIYLLKVRLYDGSDGTLVIRPGRYVYLSSMFERSIPDVKPAASLNRCLRGSRISSVEQVDLERILKINLGEGRKHLFVELFSSGNLVVVDGETSCFVMRSYSGRDRSVMLGHPYVLPPSRGANPLSPSSLPLQQIKGPAGAALTHVLSAPKEVVDEALLRCGASPAEELAPGKVEEFFAQLSQLWNYARDPSLHKPVVVHGESFHPFPFLSDHEEGVPVKNFDEALEVVFSKELVGEQSGEAQRFARTLTDAEEAARKHLENAAKLRQTIEVLSQIAPTLNQALSELRVAHRQGGWEAVKLGRVAGLELIQTDPSTGSLTFREAPVPIKINQDAWKLISELHSKQKEEEQKATRAKEKLEQLRRKLDKEAAKEEAKAREAQLRVARRREWFERFRWFNSSDGILVIAGRDADQNVAIIRRYLRPEFLALHADVHGSPLAAVQAPSSETPEGTIIEAAEFVASYSKAWDQGLLSVPVSVFLGKQVSLSPPSGTYLSKGSFMIYGERRELNARVGVSVGVEVGENWFRVIGGPTAPVAKRALAWVDLAPGDESRSELVEKVVRVLRRRLRDLGSPVSEAIRQEDVDPWVPGGRGRLIQEAKRESSDGEK